MRKTLRFWALAAVVACAATVGGCAAKTESLLPTGQLADNQLTVFWKAQLHLNERPRETVSHLYRTGNRIFAMTSANRLLAVDAFSGHFLWSVDLGSPELTPTDVYQVGHVVFVCLFDRLYGFSVEDGSRVLNRELKRAPSTRPVVSTEYVYFGTHQGWLDALALFAAGSSWNHLTHTGIIAAPVYDASRVYYANADGRVFASVASRREPVWTYQTNGAVVADLKLTGQGLVLVASRDYVLYALNPITGDVAWMATTGDPLETTPQVIGGRVYVVKRGGTLMAFEEVAGQTLWTAEGIDRTIAASPMTLFVLRDDGTIAALSTSKGEEQCRLDPGDVALVATNDIDGQLFVASRDGRIMAIREAKVKYNDPASGEDASTEAE